MNTYVLYKKERRIEADLGCLSSLQTVFIFVVQENFFKTNLLSFLNL